MPVVEFTIANQKYDISCQDGQETRIRELALSVNRRVEKLASSLGKASDSMVVALTSLMMEDEINSLNEKLSNTNALNISPLTQQNIDEKVNTAVSDTLDYVAQRIETLAQKLETS